MLSRKNTNYLIAAILIQVLIIVFIYPNYRQKSCSEEVKKPIGEMMKYHFCNSLQKQKRKSNKDADYNCEQFALEQKSACASLGPFRENCLITEEDINTMVRAGITQIVELSKDLEPHKEFFFDRWIASLKSRNNPLIGTMKEGTYSEICPHK